MKNKQKDMQFRLNYYGSNHSYIYNIYKDKCLIKKISFENSKNAIIKYCLNNYHTKPKKIDRVNKNIYI